MQKYHNNFIISGFQGLIPISNTSKFYPFIDYEELDSNRDNEEYLRKFHSHKASYGYSGPYQMMFLNDYFSGGVFINSYKLIMEYSSEGIPPTMKEFRVNKDIMITFGINYPFAIHLSDDIDDELTISVGGRFKYLQRDSFTSSLTGEEFLGLTDYSNQPTTPDIFKQITEGYYRFNLIGFDFGVTFNYDIYLFSAVLNNASLPYEGVIGSRFTGKRYDENDNEIPLSDDIYIIPAKLNLSGGITLDRLINSSVISNTFIGIDITDIFSKNFDFEHIRIGIHSTFFNILNLMLGSDFRSFTFGTSVTYSFFEVGLSYELNLDRFIVEKIDGDYSEPVDNDYFLLSINFIF
jgi:hypothetical protein